MGIIGPNGERSVMIRYGGSGPSSSHEWVKTIRYLSVGAQWVTLPAKFHLHLSFLLYHAFPPLFTPHCAPLHPDPVPFCVAHISLRTLNATRASPIWHSSYKRSLRSMSCSYSLGCRHFLACRSDFYTIDMFSILLPVRQHHLVLPSQILSDRFSWKTNRRSPAQQATT